MCLTISGEPQKPRTLRGPVCGWSGWIHALLLSATIVGAGLDSTLSEAPAPQMSYPHHIPVPGGYPAYPPQPGYPPAAGYPPMVRTAPSAFRKMPLPRPILAEVCWGCAGRGVSSSRRIPATTRLPSRRWGVPATATRVRSASRCVRCQGASTSDI
jgi:hypothetical protein